MSGKLDLRKKDSRGPAVSVDSAIKLFIAQARQRRLSPQTVTYYSYRLQAFQQYLEANAPGVTTKGIDSALVRAFLAHQTETTSVSTARRSFITLRAFFRFLVAEGYLDKNPMQNVKQAKAPKRLLQTFSERQVNAIIASCDNSFTGVRDKAMVLTLYDSGLRATELAELKLNDVDLDSLEFRVIGKGDKERRVPFGPTTKHALMAYLARRGELPTEHMFVSVYGERIERRRLYQIIKERCKHAGVTGVRCSPHTFRHTFAVQYLRAGGDVFTLQKILGHEDLETTRIYVELSKSDVAESHRMHSPADRLAAARPVTGRTRIK
jgi:site-specific recombinase XerD